MRLDRLFFGNIYTLNAETLEYGPHFAPLSLSTTKYNISFKKRTFLYKKLDGTFIDLLIPDNKNKIKSSNNISDVKIKEDFVMIDDNFISFQDKLEERGIKRKFITKNRVRNLVRKVK